MQPSNLTRTCLIGGSVAMRHLVHLSTVSTQVSQGLSQPTQTPLNTTFVSTHKHYFPAVGVPFQSPPVKHPVHYLSFGQVLHPILHGRQVLVLVCPKYFTPITSGQSPSSTHSPVLGDFKNLPGLHSRQWVVVPEHVSQSAPHWTHEYSRTGRLVFQRR